MNEPTRPVLRAAGALIAFGAIGFTAVFVWLASNFGYPDVLDRPASEVLPALLAGGTPLRTVWVLYAILPMLLSLAALMLHGRVTRGWGTAAGVLTGVAMTIGLARWSTAQWWLAEAFRDGDTSVAQTFATLNLVLGNVIGEFLGELFLAGWLFAIARALDGRWLKWTTLTLSALMVVGSIRNVTPLVQPATDVTNGLLPLVLLWLGLTWALRRARPATA